ncbi:MAG: hypothetical protein U1E03_01865 [Hyphomonadaceae bacterium]
MIERFASLRDLPSKAHRAWRQTRAYALRTWRNPEKRERIKATTTFAFIAAFTVVSLDHLITGGTDWNPDGGQAYAMEVSRSFAQPVAPQVQTAELTSLAPVLAETEEPEPVDYSYTTETLLGGPDTELPTYRPFADGFTDAADKALTADYAGAASAAVTGSKAAPAN